nr:LysR substrate-binding domain-containing protein [Streptomyces boncukensis]
MSAVELLAARAPELSVLVCEVPVADPGLSQGRALLTEGRVLALPSAHPLAERSVLSLEDLAGVPLLTFPCADDAACRERYAPSRTPSGRPVPSGPEVFSDQEALVFVAAGQGAWLAAAHATTYHRRPGVTYVPVPDAEPMTYGLVRRKGHDAPAVRAFERAAEEAGRD